ncbi:MAG: hypothetical protein PHE80_02030 [Candidatus Omnitrophica bacterium]|nr:hypothetical protein [Candidatus Omnitrophota bacterium]MDD5737034.1 hypothetical protein [Candidatus Omnitrophota bacterium]
MACFLVPAGTAILTSAIRKKVPEKYHLNWLNSMLWGGVVMLAVEHIAHGEVVLYPPFLTAGLAEVLPEMLKVGVPMTLSIFVIWGIMVAIAAKMRKKLRYAAT